MLKTIKNSIFYDYKSQVQTEVGIKFSINWYK